MKTDISLSIDHPYFNEPYRTRIEWDFPFLPREGEFINGWIWIDERISLKDIKPYLSSEGKESLQKWEGEISDWMYEVSIAAGDVRSVSYYRDKNDPKKIVAHLSLCELNP